MCIIEHTQFLWYSNIRGVTGHYLNIYMSVYIDVYKMIYVPLTNQI